MALEVKLTIDDDETVKAILKLLLDRNGRKGKIVKKGRKDQENNKRLPLSTLNSILNIIQEQYGSVPHFRGVDAVSLVQDKLGIGRTTTNYALRCGIEKGIIAKASRHFTFRKNPALDRNALVDIATSHDNELASAFRLVSKYSSGVSLYFNQEGIRARFNSRDKSAIVDLRIDGALFESWHVRDHVKLTTYSSKLAKVGTFRLVLQNEGDYFQFGDLELAVLAREHSKSPFAVETYLPEQETIAEVVMPKGELKSLLENLQSAGERFTVKCNKDGFTFISEGYASRYSKTLPLPRSCVESSEGSYSIKAIMPVLLVAADAFKIRLVKCALVVSPLIEHIRLDVHMPVLVQEKVEPQAAAVKT